MCVVENFSQGVDDHGIAAVVNIISVVAHPVDACHIDLVFDSAGLEEGFPGMATAFGPVGYINEQSGATGAWPDRGAGVAGWEPGDVAGSGEPAGRSGDAGGCVTGDGEPAARSVDAGGCVTGDGGR